jgi:hypothetical protein
VGKVQVGKKCKQGGKGDSTDTPTRDNHIGKRVRRAKDQPGRSVGDAGWEKRYAGCKG